MFVVHQNHSSLKHVSPSVGQTFSSALDIAILYFIIKNDIIYKICIIYVIIVFILT